MVMRIALLLRQKKQEETDRAMSHVVVFNVEQEKVIGVENETVASEMSSLFYWALAEKVNIVYIPVVDGWAKALFRVMGITLKGYDEAVDDKLFQTFIL